MGFHKTTLLNNPVVSTETSRGISIDGKDARFPCNVEFDIATESY
jgi:hypothetical protein